MRVGRLFGLTVAAAVMAASIAVGAAPAAEAKAKPKLRVLDATVTEGTGGQGIVAFSVRLSSPAKKALHFTWSTRNGTAKAGADFKRVKSGTGTIKKGHTSAVLLVRVDADAIDEYTETFTVHIGGAPSWVNLADANAIGTILDNDARPKLKVIHPQVVEGLGKRAIQRSITVQLGRPSGKPIAVSYTVKAGSAKFGKDLAKFKKPKLLKIKPGKTKATIKLGVFGDTKVEKNKTFKLVFSHPSNVRLAKKRTTITLLDNDGQPTILGMTPAGPSPNGSPLIHGTAPDKSKVAVYLNGTCTGSPVATGKAAAFNGAGIEVPVAPNVTNTLSVKATDTPWGMDSACTAPVTYVHDNIAPDAPINLVTDPTSPTRSHSATVTGTAEAESEVAVYVGAGCTGTPFTGSAEAFGSTGIQVTGLLEGSNTISVTATDAARNTSACSSTSLVVDTTAPAAPASLAVVGGRPTSDSTPSISGTAETDSTVAIYLNGSCSGTAQGTGSQATFSSAGITLPSLDDDSYTVTANTTDDAGNTSTCSDPLTFRVDTTAPEPPDSLALAGTSPTADATPTITGNAEADSTVSLYDSPTCSGSPVATTTATDVGTFSVATSTLVDGPHTITATATDAAQNASLCTSPPLPFVVDTQGPDAPGDLHVTDGLPDGFGLVVAADAEPGVMVQAFLDNPCTAMSADTFGVTSMAGSVLMPFDVTLSEGDHDIFARATDTAGNKSGCAGPIEIEVDRTPPPPPILAPVDYGVSPAITGTASGAEQVHVYLNSGCAGPPLVSGTAGAFATSGLPLGDLAPGDYTVTATSEDQSGYVSTCSDPEPFEVP